MKNFIFSSKVFKGSKYGIGHPLNIDRVWPSLELLRKMNWVQEKEIILNEPATIEELNLFHDLDYLKTLQQAELEQKLSEDKKNKFKIGIGVNPIFNEVYSRPAAAAKSTILAVEFLAKDKANKILNFSGGTHHGRKSYASGFCFLNDCILAILKAKIHYFKRILYIDIDAHHCDAVQDFFQNEDNIQIISIHQKNKWPKTGKLEDSKIQNIINVPVPQLFNDSEMSYILENLIIPYARRFKPDITIIQGGADCLKDDPQSNMNLSLSCYWSSISKFVNLSKKTLILGGGGYNPYQTAKAWAGNWLILNSKENLLNKNLNEECKNLLRSLKWNNSRVKNGIPDLWLDSWLDKFIHSKIREEIIKTIEALRKIKNL